MLLLACAPIFSALAQAKVGIQPAQYRLLSKGDAMPYTGVAVGLATYRAETKKFKTLDALIKSQDDLIAGLRLEVTQSESQKAKLTQQLLLESELLQSSEDAKVVIQKSLADTQKAYEKNKPKFYEKPLFLFVSGVASGGFLAWKAGNLLHIF